MEWIPLKLVGLRPRNAATAADSLSGGDVFLIAIWSGLLTWLGELSVQAVRAYVWGTLHLIYRPVLILGPIGYLLLFTIIGGLLYGIRRGIPRLASPGLLLGTLFFLSAICILAIFRAEFQTIPSIILGLGIASALMRLAVAHRSGFTYWVRRTLAPLALLVLFIGAGYGLMRSAQERYALARLPNAPKDSPNVILITLDTVRAHSLSLYGNN